MPINPASCVQCRTCSSSPIGPDAGRRSRCESPTPRGPGHPTVFPGDVAVDGRGAHPRKRWRRPAYPPRCRRRPGRARSARVPAAREEWANPDLGEVALLPASSVPDLVMMRCRGRRLNWTMTPMTDAGSSFYGSVAYLRIGGLSLAPAMKAPHSIARIHFPGSLHGNPDRRNPLPNDAWELSAKGLSGRPPVEGGGGGHE